jgi:Spc19
VEKYKADLGDEIEPQITELISRAEKGLKALQKKQHLLQTKVLIARPFFCIVLVLAAKQSSRLKQLSRDHNRE